MAVKVNAPLIVVKTALEMSIASAKRAMNSTKEPQFKELYEIKIQELQQALGTLTEIK